MGSAAISHLAFHWHISDSSCLHLLCKLKGRKSGLQQGLLES